MPKMKLKTHKAAVKRVKVKKSGKMVHRTAGQDHFNSRETGKVKRNKRRDGVVSDTIEKNLKKLLPYN